MCCYYKILVIFLMLHSISLQLISYLIPCISSFPIPSPFPLITGNHYFVLYTCESASFFSIPASHFCHTSWIPQTSATIKYMSTLKNIYSVREWHDILKVMKGKNLQPRILYPARLWFRSDGEIKSFTHKWKLRELSTTKPALQWMLKELL